MKQWRVLIASCWSGKRPKHSPFRFTKLQSSFPGLRLTAYISDKASLCLSGLKYCRTSGQTPGEFLHFLGQARSSLLELDTQLAIALDLCYLKPDQYEILDRDTYQVLGLLNRLIESLRKGRAQPESKP